MRIQYSLLVLRVAILLAGDHTKVWVSVPVDANWYLHSHKLSKVFGVLHIFEDQALLHLADVLLLDDSHEARESAVNGVLLESVTLLNALAHKAFTTLL